MALAHIAHNTTEPKPTHSYIFDLTEAVEPGDFSQKDTVVLAQERSVEMTHTYNLSVTVGAEEKIGGSFAGVSAEATFKQELGISNTDEEKRGCYRVQGHY